jgi:soluble lytic murein transglycosylase
MNPYRRRPLAGAVVAIALTAMLVVAIAPRFDHAVNDLKLPLSHASIIREQAAEKHLDPALIAAVIYAESKFEPRTSSAGAEGLMQIEPATAEFLARLTGGYRFTRSDLGTPSVNVAYGSYYLRYLLNHYQGHELPAIAAYNAGLANVDRWMASAAAENSRLTVASIPFPETRAYVQRVMAAQREYRVAYPRELGLE